MALNHCLKFFLFLLIGVLSAQKKEIEAGLKALESSNLKEVSNIVKSVEPLINHETEGSLQRDFYLLKAISLLNEKKIEQASDAFAIAFQEDWWQAKNNLTKNKVFFHSKKEAEEKLKNNEISNLKPLKVSSNGSKFLLAIFNTYQPEAQKYLEKARKAYTENNYTEAGDLFLSTYYFTKIINQEDLLFKYYAGASYLNAREFNKAIQIFEELLARNYTGVTTTYFITDKTDGKEYTATKEQFELAKKDPQRYTNFRSETSPSIEMDMYYFIADCYRELKNYEKANEVIQRGLAKDPNNKNLNDIAMSVAYESGEHEKFVKSLRESLLKDPKNHIYHYNLGVMLSKSKNENERKEAEQCYAKAIELKPDYYDAYINMAALIIDEDKEVVKEIEKLKGTKADLKKNEELFKKRQALNRKALPFLLKAHELKKDDIELVRSIKIVYDIIGDEAKYKEFKALEKAMQQK